MIKLKSGFGLTSEPHQFNLTRQSHTFIVPYITSKYFNYLVRKPPPCRIYLDVAAVFSSFWPFIFVRTIKRYIIWNISVASSGIWARCSLNISLFLAILCVYYTAPRFITDPRICQTVNLTKVLLWDTKRFDGKHFY